ncbi:tetratricopeptide repeat protein [Lentzea tibetensis]|uniref:Tetratricopeptide repeat protein n=1 Tax=Lentzea tibetensis TaxID=2591470 RepID=A0A563EWG6_9PSEU|nr:tetratricopeptide repeat protein [Lentzea tibetensis]TWP52045.1 tetratricopeptide repeat protein [Lentzea tibetensis]
MTHRVKLALAAMLVIAAGLALLTGHRDSDSPPSGVAVAVKQENQMHRSVHALQERLHRVPNDENGWAELGAVYVELSRVTADPSYYNKAQGALQKSASIRPNGMALIGQGQLANARHDFGAARDFANQALQALPSNSEALGVLADALTQLGDDAGAQQAVQRMLDVKPNTASFARASYHFELHGDVPAAEDAMRRALTAAANPDDVAFCRYRLGELAFDNGRLDEASDHYDQGLAAREDDMALTQGKAKVAAARGDVDGALAGYQRLVQRAPVPQYVVEYAELLESAGRKDEAEQQYTVLSEQQRLMESEGASDDLSAAMVAADRGDGMQALRRAEAEWGRRQAVFVADAMAWALHRNGRDAEALTFADKAASLGWRNATFAYHRGMILAALGRNDEAEKSLAEALRLNPHFSPLYQLTAGRKLAELRGQR